MNHLKGLRPILTILVLVVVLLSVFPTPAHAITDPSSPPQVNGVFVYELLDGGLGVLLEYNIDYAVLPPTGETATESYMAVFIDTDGTTQLKAVAPYTFQNSGYGLGVIWIPFTADEVTTYGLDSANQALYRIWLMGNPTLAWPTVPPKTIATISSWQTTGDPRVFLALKVLSEANTLELDWSLSLLSVTSLGSRLTALGESYFENVIPNLRTLAPSVFASGTQDPTQGNTDYTTSFGAVVRNGTGTVVGSPLTLASGNTTITVTAGTLIVDLNAGTSGNITSGVGGVVAGSPLHLSSGNNTITVTAPGTLYIEVRLLNTQTRLSSGITGTGFDMTNAAAAFGMSRDMFSGLIWLALSIAICAAVYKPLSQGSLGESGGASKLVMLVFDICIIAGALLGLLSMIIAILLFIAWSAFIGYVWFFRGANI